MKIGIIGAGVLGSVHRDWLLNNTENEVLVYDIDEKKANSSFESLVQFAEMIFICIPTDGKENGDLDCKALDEVIEKIVDQRVAYGEGDKILPIVIRSTVPTGYCRRKNEKIKDKALQVLFYPEFLTEKTAEIDFQTPQKIVIGCREGLRDKKYEGDLVEVASMFRRAVPFPKNCEIWFVNYEVAETLKLATNSFYALKVIFANELSDFCRGFEVDYDQVRKLLCKDPRIGSSLFDDQGVDVHFRIAQDGLYGFGGKCLPKDIAQLANLMKNSGTGYGLLDKTIAINKKIRKGKI